MTAFYSMRLIYSAFYNTAQGTRGVMTHAAEPGIAMSIPLVVLMIASIYIGYVMKDVMIGVGSPYLDFVGKEAHHSMESEFIPTGVK
jgi:NADH-ubiquinone oxidoreductase chain 5